MDDLIKSLTILSQQECERAVAQYGKKHNSAHESYARIKEKFDKAMNDLHCIDFNLNDFWQAVMAHQPEKISQHSLKIIEMTAIKAAAELIQVSAMAHKALQGYTVNDKEA